MPLNSIPAEVFGHVFLGLRFASDQASFRAVNHHTLRGFNLAVINQRFVAIAGSSDEPFQLTDYSVRWAPVSRWRCNPKIVDFSGGVDIVVKRGPRLHTVALTSRGYQQVRCVLADNILVVPDHSRQLKYFSREWLRQSSMKALRFEGSGSDWPAEVGQYFLANCEDLKALSLPSSITALGTSFCFQCITLTAVSLPDAVTAIPLGCLACCTSLTSVKLPKSLVEIGDGFLRSCASIRQVELPPNVRTIGADCFDDCSELVTVKLSASLEEIGQRFMRSCESICNLDLPSSLTKVQPVGLTQP